VAFVAAGVFFVRPDTPWLPSVPAPGAVGDAALLLIFAFIGIEMALVPSGEVANPARTVPRAIFLALGTTTLVYLAIQFVAQGILGPDLGRYADAPLAEAARRSLGPAAQAVMVAGALVSMFGYASGDMLATPRLLFAFGRDRVLPTALARVHPRYRTPHVAIVVYGVMVAALAIIGSFAVLALLSNIATLSLYLICCAGAWELSRRDVRSGGVPFRAPGGAAVPLLACLAILWLLAHATWQEIAAEAAVLGLATLVYFYVLRPARHGD
jgi:amino acid transporter